MARAASRSGRTTENVLIVLGLLALLLIGNRAIQPTAPEQPAQPGGGGALGTLVAPVPGGRVTSGFGGRWGTRHNGTDVAAPIGTPIRAIAAGTVIVARPASGFGLWMQVRHGDGTVSVYGHMNRMLRPVGARVKAGEQIAEVGQRGQSTGPHLHLEIWPGGNRSKATDPARWFAQRKAPLTSRQ